MQANQPRDEWVPISDYPSLHPWPSEQGLRAYWRDRTANGLDACFLKHGRRVLVNPARLFRALEQRGAA
jgi:hypothetical protein